MEKLQPTFDAIAANLDFGSPIRAKLIRYEANRINAIAQNVQTLVRICKEDNYYHVKEIQAYNRMVMATLRMHDIDELERQSRERVS